MRSIGIRELRQQASKHLRDVEAGETIEVTDRGRPVALLVPVPQADAIQRLVASGRLVRGTGDLLSLGPPLRPAPGMPLPSEALERLRADER
ncbi:MAG TPA: type II toxin-antitoxin system prevent-host-death family antitoxin [Solirubrobacteraceae bacterium]|jgi:prevent-host-death family protein